jgi:hypothetical protein
MLRFRPEKWGVAELRPHVLKSSGQRLSFPATASQIATFGLKLLPFETAANVLTP